MTKAQASACITMMALAGIDPSSLPTHEHRNARVEGRVVGRDNGISLRKQPRNAPCQCGSGKKAKRCCVWLR